MKRRRQTLKKQRHKTINSDDEKCALDFENAQTHLKNNDDQTNQDYQTNVPNDTSSKSSNVPNDKLPEHSSVPSENLPRSSGVSNDELPESLNVPSENLPGSSVVPNDKLPECSNVPSGKLPGSSNESGLFSDDDCQLDDSNDEDFIEETPVESFETGVKDASTGVGETGVKAVKHIGRRKKLKGLKIDEKPNDVWSQLFASTTGQSVENEIEAITSESETEENQDENRRKVWNQLITHVINDKSKKRRKTQNTPQHPVPITPDLPTPAATEENVNNAEPDLDGRTSVPTNSESLFSRLETSPCSAERSEDLEDALAACSRDEQTTYFAQKQKEMQEIQRLENSRKRVAREMKIARDNQLLLTTLRFLCENQPMWSDPPEVSGRRRGPIAPQVALPLDIQRDFRLSNTPLLSSENQERRSLRRKADWSHKCHSSIRWANLLGLINLQPPAPQTPRDKLLVTVEAKWLQLESSSSNNSETSSLGRLNQIRAMERLKEAFPIQFEKLTRIAEPTDSDLLETRNLVERLGNNMLRWFDATKGNYSGKENSQNVMREPKIPENSNKNIGESKQALGEEVFKDKAGADLCLRSPMHQPNSDEPSNLDVLLEMSTAAGEKSQMNGESEIPPVEQEIGTNVNESTGDSEQLKEKRSEMIDDVILVQEENTSDEETPALNVIGRDPEETEDSPCDPRDDELSESRLSDKEEESSDKENLSGWGSLRPNLERPKNGIDSRFIVRDVEVGDAESECSSENENKSEKKKRREAQVTDSDEEEEDEEEHRKVYESLIAENPENIKNYWSAELQELHRKLMEDQSDKLYRRNFTMQGLLEYRNAIGPLQDLNLTRRQKIRKQAADRADENLLDEEAEVEALIADIRRKRLGRISDSSSNSSSASIDDADSSDDEDSNTFELGSTQKKAEIYVKNMRRKIESTKFEIREKRSVKETQQKESSKQSFEHPAFMAKKTSTIKPAFLFSRRNNMMPPSASSRENYVASLSQRLRIAFAKRAVTVKSTKLGFMEQLMSTESITQGQQANANNTANI